VLTAIAPPAAPATRMRIAAAPVLHGFEGGTLHMGIHGRGGHVLVGSKRRTTGCTSRKPLVFRHVVIDGVHSSRTVHLDISF